MREAAGYLMSRRMPKLPADVIFLELLNPKHLTQLCGVPTELFITYSFLLASLRRHNLVERANAQAATTVMSVSVTYAGLTRWFSIGSPAASHR